MKRHIKAANKIGKEIEQHIEKRRKDEPELDQWLKTHPL